MAGKPSHPPRMHKFNAGVQSLAKCLPPQGVESSLKTEDLDANLDPKTK